MANIFYTSDLHFGHQKIAEIRGFDNVTDHDQAIINAWEDTVRPDDEVWVLGDLCLSKSALPLALDRIRSLPGTKHLVFGNHDAGHPLHKRAHRFHDVYLQAFDTVQSAATHRVGGERVILSHFPYSGDHTTEERYPEWRPIDAGQPIIHGHTHSGNKLSRTPSGTRQVHVGVDAWNLKPVSVAEVEWVLGLGEILAA